MPLNLNTNKLVVLADEVVAATGADIFYDTESFGDEEGTYEQSIETVCNGSAQLARDLKELFGDITKDDIEALQDWVENQDCDFNDDEDEEYDNRWNASVNRQRNFCIRLKEQFS